MPISRLSGVKAHEVSLVKRGANKKPFLVLKNEQGAQQSPAKFFVLSDEQEAQFDHYLQHRLQAVRKDDEAPNLSDRAQAALKAVYRILLPFRDEISEDDIDELIGEIGVNSEGESDSEEDAEEEDEAYADEQSRVQQSADMKPTSEGDSEMGDKAKQFEKAADDFKKPDGVDEDAHTAAMKAAQDAYKKAVGKSKTDKAADEKEEEMEKTVKKSDGSDELLQALPPEARAYFSMVQKRSDMANEMLVRKSEALAAEVASMKEEKELAGYAETLSQFGNLSLDIPKQSRLLKSLKANDAEAYDSYLEQLRTSNEQVRVSKSFNNNLYGSMGSASHAARPGQTSQTTSGSAAAQLETMVNNFVAKSGESLPEHKKWEAVLSTPEGIALYERAGQEKRG